MGLVGGAMDRGAALGAGKGAGEGEREGAAAGAGEHAGKGVEDRARVGAGFRPQGWIGCGSIWKSLGGRSRR